MLEHIEQALAAGPQRIAGMTFSDRLLRYIYFERRNGVYTLGSWGEIIIPFDVIEKGHIVLPIEFTKHVKSLISAIPTDTKICIKKDDDEHKMQSLKLAGYRDVTTVQLPEALAPLYVQVGVDGSRVCLFVMADAVTVFLYDHTQFHKSAVIEIDQLQTAPAIINDLLQGCENKKVLYVGKGEKFISHLTASGIELDQSDIFKNIFDVSRYIPELPREESYRYSVPTALALFSLHFKNAKTKKDKAHGSSKKPIDRSYGELTPLTKSKDDKRKKSDKKPKGRYKKLMYNKDITK